VIAGIAGIVWLRRKQNTDHGPATTD